MKARLLFLVIMLSVQYSFCQVFTQPVAAPVDIAVKPELLWKYKTNGPIVASPVIDHGMVFVGSLDSSLYAIDLVTGKEKWKLPTGGAIRSSVCVMPQRLFLLSTDGILYRMEKDSGRVDGLFQSMTGFVGDGQADYIDYFSSTPVLADSAIFFGCGESIYAISLVDGYTRWTFKTGGVVHTRPVVSGGKLFAGTFDGYLYAIDIRTGLLSWKFKTMGSYGYPKGEITGNPVAIGNKVIFGARDNILYAVDTRGGFCHWFKQFPNGWGLSATINDSVLYAGTFDDRKIFAYDLATGRELWKVNSGFNILGGISIGDTMGYVGLMNGKIAGLDLRRGLVKWTAELDNNVLNGPKYFVKTGLFREDVAKKFRTPLDVQNMYNQLGSLFGTPAMYMDKLVVAGYDGWVYCFTAPSKKP